MKLNNNVEIVQKQESLHEALIFVQIWLKLEIGYRGED